MIEDPERGCERGQERKGRAEAPGAWAGSIKKQGDEVKLLL